jgi:exosome complex RNA-binding protein Csl4
MKIRGRVVALLTLTVLILGGCHELGHIDGLGDYGNLNSDIVGEVQSVDARTREIDVRTDSGRTVIVRYDNNTQVVYKQRNYPVANLESGDYIAARVQQDRDGSYFTQAITVREAQQERAGSTPARLDRTSGRVEYIDPKRGTFELRDARQRLVVVSIDFNASRDVSDRFNRLRNGDTVRIEGKFVGQDRFELENFL